MAETFAFGEFWRRLSHLGKFNTCQWHYFGNPTSSYNRNIQQRLRRLKRCHAACPATGTHRDSHLLNLCYNHNKFDTNPCRISQMFGRVSNYVYLCTV
jgi:hypothetical protein